LQAILKPSEMPAEHLMITRREIISAAAIALTLASRSRSAEPAEPAAPATARSAADPRTYLAALINLLQIPWPKNRTINIDCHGHSVPAGYFKTPLVK
jgi:hypothetical protein